MKNHTRLILLSSCSFILGSIAGATILFYLTRDLPARFQFYTMSTYVTANAVQNTFVLTHLRKSEIEKAIEILEKDLDTNITSLNALRQGKDILSLTEKEKIEDKLQCVKKYRLNYPRIYQNAEMGKMVEDALAGVKLHNK